MGASACTKVNECNNYVETKKRDTSDDAIRQKSDGDRFIGLIRIQLVTSIVKDKLTISD